MPKTIWHNMITDGDTWSHVFGKPADCYCEPEVDVLGTDAMGIEHKVIRHQDMTGKILTTIGEV